MSDCANSRLIDSNFSMRVEEAPPWRIILQNWRCLAITRKLPKRNTLKIVDVWPSLCEAGHSDAGRAPCGCTPSQAVLPRRNVTSRHPKTASDSPAERTFVDKGCIHKKRCANCQFCAGLQPSFYDSFYSILSACNYRNGSVKLKKEICFIGIKYIRECYWRW